MAERSSPLENSIVNEDDIDLTDEADRSAKPSFAESQLLSKKELKRARKTNRQCVDVSTDVSKEQGPSYTVKRIKKDESDVAEKRAEAFDYSQFRPDTFNQRSATQDNSFDPFNQKYRVENKKNFRRRGRGGHHRMGNMSIGYTPSPKK